MKNTKVFTCTLLVLNFAIWQGNISQGFIFAISIGKYEKRALNFAIEAFSTSFYFSKGLNCLKFLDNWNRTKHIFEN